MLYIYRFCRLEEGEEVVSPSATENSTVFVRVITTLLLALSTPCESVQEEEILSKSGHIHGVEPN